MSLNQHYSGRVLMRIAGTFQCVFFFEGWDGRVFEVVEVHMVQLIVLFGVATLGPCWAGPFFGALLAMVKPEDVQESNQLGAQNPANWTDIRVWRWSMWPRWFCCARPNFQTRPSNHGCWNCSAPIKPVRPPSPGLIVIGFERLKIA